MFIFYEFIPFLYRQRARYLSKNTVSHIQGITASESRSTWNC